MNLQQHIHELRRTFIHSNYGKEPELLILHIKDYRELFFDVMRAMGNNNYEGFTQYNGMRIIRSLDLKEGEVIVK